MKRLLITGGSGDLGFPLSRLAVFEWETLNTYFSNDQVGGGEAVQIDLRDQEATIRLVKAFRPEVIIHTATSDRSDDMVRANRLAAQHIAEAAQAIHSRLIALSTDMVFDGTQPPYPETASPEPLSPYGKVKAENEKYLLKAHGNCLIVRTSLIYDFTPGNRQLSWMIEKIEAGEKVGLFVDEIRQPVWAINLSEALLELAESDSTGILHVAGGRPMNRWEYGRALLGALGYDADRVTVPVEAEKVAPQRPRNCTMRLDRARSLLQTRLLTVEEALAAHSPGQASSTTTSR